MLFLIVYVCNHSRSLYRKFSYYIFVGLFFVDLSAKHDCFINTHVVGDVMSKNIMLSKIGELPGWRSELVHVVGAVGSYIGTGCFYVGCIRINFFARRVNKVSH